MFPGPPPSVTTECDNTEPLDKCEKIRVVSGMWDMWPLSVTTWGLKTNKESKKQACSTLKILGGGGKEMGSYLQKPVSHQGLCSKKLFEELTLLLWGRLSCFSFSTFLKTCTQFFLIGQSLVFLQTILFIYHLFTQKKRNQCPLLPLVSFVLAEDERFPMNSEPGGRSNKFGHWTSE